MKRRSVLRTLLAFTLPFLLFTVVAALLRIAPFGERTLLVYDAKSQYISYFSALVRMLRTGEGTLYTLSGQLGMSTMGLLSYYLMSPFNLIFLAFPVGAFDVGFTLLTALKLGAIGAAMYTAMRDIKEDTMPPLSLALSTAYALCSYSCAYFANSMWLDAMIFAPLVLSGLYRLAQGRCSVRYVVSLALCLMTCYYTGYMVCIFAVVIWASLCISVPGSIRRTHRFIYQSLLAGALAAVVLLPAAFSLMGGKGQGSTTVYLWRIKPLELMSSLATGSFSIAKMIYGPPNIFCTLIAVLIALCALSDPRMKARVRAGVCLSLVFFAVCFLFEWPDNAMHGFNGPNWFTFRFSFLFVLLVVLLAYTQLGAHGAKRIAICAAIIAALYILALFSLGTMSKKMMLIDMAVLALGAALFTCATRSRWACVSLALLIVANLGFNMVDTLQTLLPQSADTAFCDSQEDTDALIREITAQDDGVYRIENAAALNNNDPLFHGYAGISHYSSLGRFNVRSYLRALGYTDNGIYSSYIQGSTLAADALLSIKYVLSPTALYDGQQPLTLEGGTSVWENPYALPLAFASPPTVDTLSSPDNRPFARVNELYESLAGKAVFSPHEASLTPTLGEEDIRLQLTVEQHAPLYVYLQSLPASEGTCIYVNDQQRALMPTGSTRVTLCLGTFSIGDQVDIRIDAPSSKVPTAILCYEDTQALSDAAALAAANAVHWESFEQDSGHGSFTADADDQLLFLLSHDESLHVEIDGKPIKTAQTLGLFLSVPITAGTHTVRFYYLPKGLAAGACISALSLLAAVIIVCSGRRKRQAA